LLDNAVTWNYHLSQPQVCPFEAKHKLYDHGVLSFALPTEDFITTFKALKRSFDIPTDRVDVVFFQRNLLQWHKNVQQRISPFANNGVEETDYSLLNTMREEQDIMRGEALKLQGRAETSRRRARERRPNRTCFTSSSMPSCNFSTLLAFPTVRCLRLELSGLCRRSFCVGSTEDTNTLLDIVSEFQEWSGMKISIKKFLATGALYGRGETQRQKDASTESRKRRAPVLPQYTFKAVL